MKKTINQLINNLVGLNFLYKSLLVMISLIVLLPTIGIFTLAINVFFDMNTLSNMNNSVLFEYTNNTFALCFGTLTVALLVSIPTAWILSFYEIPFKKFLDWLCILPMVLPAYVLAYAYTDALDYSGWLSSLIRSNLFELGFVSDSIEKKIFWPEIRSLSGACFVMGVALSPYLTLLARAAFESRQLNLIDAAKTMGVSGYKLFFTVSIPLARPAIVAGSSLVLMECLADYGTVSFFSVQTLSSGLYKSWFGYGDLSTASLIGLIMMIVAFISLIVEKFSRKEREFGNTNPLLSNPMVRLNCTASFVAFLVCSFGGIFGFILPMVFLLKASFDEFYLGYFTIHSLVSLGQSLLNSLLLALTAVFLILIVSFLVAYVVRNDFSKKINYWVQFLVSGYAVAGLVSAISLLYLSGFMTTLLTNYAGVSFSLSTTVILLLIAYVSRFFAVGYSPISVGLQGITTSIDNSARTFGLSNKNLFYRLHLPLLRSATILAATLIFLDVIKELPATLVLRPLGMETLSVSAYNLASDERLGAAALPSVLMALTGILPLLIIKRRWKEIKNF